MRSKADIERTLAHMKTDCPTDASTNAVWITALEWVLGDEKHRKAYSDWLEAVAPPAAPYTDYTVRELDLLYCLQSAFNRLR